MEDVEDQVVHMSELNAWLSLSETVEGKDKMFNCLSHHVGGGIGLSLVHWLDHAPDRPPLVAVEGRQDAGMVVTTPGPVLAHFLGKESLIVVDEWRMMQATLSADAIGLLAYLGLSLWLLLMFGFLFP